MPGYAGCHPWNLNLPDCHDKMINTWWYGSTSTATFTDYFTSIPAPPTGQGDSRCGPGTVTLTATVLSSQTIDWYADSVGGTPLLSGNTTFVTPVIIVTTTFYAEARNDSSNCTSAIRTPVVATVLPAPVPTITGNTNPCINAGILSYVTEPGMSNYQWNISPGGTIVNGQGTYQTTVIWGVTGNLWISVGYSNAIGT